MAVDVQPVESLLVLRYRLEKIKPLLWKSTLLMLTVGEAGLQCILGSLLKPKMPLSAIGSGYAD